MIRVLLVDDQELVRTGLRGILRPTFGFDVVGECADGSDVGVTVESLHPDVVLMDVRMPVVDGVEATRRLRRQPDSPPVLVLTTFDDDEVLAGALRAGASGFVLKDLPAEDLQRAVRVVADGGAWLDPAVTGRVLRVYRARRGTAFDGAEPGRPRAGRADGTRTRGAGPDRARADERRDRVAPVRRRGHRQDARQPHLRQARPARSGRRRGVRLRPRRRVARPVNGFGRPVIYLMLGGQNRRQPQPLTAPAVRPVEMRFWKMTNSTTTGSDVSVAAAISPLQSAPCTGLLWKISR